MLTRNSVITTHWTQKDCVRKIRSRFVDNDVKYAVLLSVEYPVDAILLDFIKRSRLNDIIKIICDDYSKEKVVFAFKYVLEELRIIIKIKKRKKYYLVKTAFYYPREQFEPLTLPVITMIPNVQHENTMKERNPEILMTELAERILKSDEHVKKILEIIEQHDKCVIIYENGNVYDY